MSTGSHAPSTIEPAQTLLLVADFCQANPHVKIEYIDGAFSMEYGMSHQFIQRGVYLAVAIRQKPLNYVLAPAENLSATSWTSDQGVARMDVPNLRFWPAERLIARRDETQLQKSSRVTKWLRSHPRWRTLVKGWIENGI